MEEKRRTTSGAPRHAARPAGEGSAPKKRPAGSTSVSGAPKKRPVGSAAASGVPKKRPAGSAPQRRPSPSPARYSRRQRNTNWSMVLALAIIVIILIGILALIILGVKSCSSGCSSGKRAVANNGPAQIYMETPEPQETPAAQVVDNVIDVQPAETAAAEPTAPAVLPTPAANVRTDANGLRSATIRTAGDFVIHDVVFQSAARLAKQTNSSDPFNFRPMLNLIRDQLENADFTVTNVDGSMGGKQYYKYGYSGYPQFNTPPHILYALVDAGVDMLTLANNHMLDGWFDGLMAEIANVEKVGLKHVGANRSAEEKNTPVVYEINGIKVGFMNYTVSLNEMDKKGVDSRALEFGVNATKNSDPKKDAKALRDAGADVIVCYMHWGKEYEEMPDDNQKKLANILVASGCDVIVGGHPHVVQYATWLSGTNQFGEAQQTLCVYSLGNFLSDQRLALRDGGILFDFTIQEQADGSFSIINPSYLPTWVWRTGDKENGFNYSVVPIGKYLDTRPEGMSDADYTRMLQSYQESVNAMQKGNAGTLIAD